jgi:hypothetical protein
VTGHDDHDELDEDPGARLRGARLLTAASANGWRVLGRAECATIAVPGGTLQVHPKTAAIFADLAARFHAEVEPLVWPGCWGYALRPIKGTDTYSNHSSGTSIDLNAPAHPQGVTAAKTFTAAQIAAVREIVASYHGVITWGGEWKLPSTDGMHFEVTEGTSVAAVDALAAALSGGAAPPPPAPAPVPAPAPGGPDLTGRGTALRGDVGNTGPRVAQLQAFLNRYAPAYSHLVVDRVWGPATTAVLAQFAHRSGIPSADGLNIGPKIAAALYAAGFDRTAAQARALAHLRRSPRAQQ